jgi:hypothetical protein
MDSKAKRAIDSMGDMAPSLLALAVFMFAVAALALARYRTTLD